MTICRMSCRTMASKRFDGKRWRSVSTAVFGFASASPDGGRCRPIPGLTTWAKTRPMTRAIVVATSK